jgi:hypothetical protein
VLKGVRGAEEQSLRLRRMMATHSQAEIESRSLTVGHQHTPWVVASESAVSSMDATLKTSDAFHHCPYWQPAGIADAFCSKTGGDIDVRAHVGRLRIAAGASAVR